MDPTTAAWAIAAWVEKRFYKEFWYCRQCAWEGGYPEYEHNHRISNYGVCESCHNQEDYEQMDYECDMGPCKEFHAKRRMRWVGPRMQKHYDRLEATWPRRKAAMERERERERRVAEEREMFEYAAWRIARWIDSHYKSA